MFLGPSEFRALVSGQQRGLTASLARGLLRTVEVPYSLAMRVRNHRYSTGRSQVHRVSVPVISVGNLTLGGTGKTPMVEWLARWFRQRGARVAIISRGYGAEAGGRNDEALELEQKLPDVPHLQNPNRVEAAAVAVEEFETQLIILDDAFQHRRIHRDLNVVLLDALEPFGFGHVFPRGTLREPLAGLARADCVVLSRADMASDEERRTIRHRVAKIAPESCWMEATHAPQRLIRWSGMEAELQSLAGKRVAAFCGLGNPAGFRHTLLSCGYEVVDLREFPDHHNYTRDDVQSLNHWAENLGAGALVCTHKDLVKLSVDNLSQRPLWALAIGLNILAGRTELEAKLQQLLERVQNPP